MTTASPPPRPKESPQRLAFWRRLVGLPPSVFPGTLQTCFAAAQKLAQDLGPAYCTHLHMLLALSVSEQGIAAQALRALGFHGQSAADEVTRLIHAGQRTLPPARARGFNRGMKITLALAGREAKRMRDYYVGTHHVLLALSAREDLCRQLLREHGIGGDAIHRAIEVLAEEKEPVD